MILEPNRGPGKLRRRHYLSTPRRGKRSFTGAVTPGCISDPSGSVCSGKSETPHGWDGRADPSFRDSR